MVNRELGGMRKDYRAGSLERSELPEGPLDLFRTWFEVAREEGEDEPNGMALATVSEAGSPSVRIVLMKGLDERGFVFYTNYESRKARELEAGGRAAATFWWHLHERQVRIEGVVVRVPEEESDAYYQSRPTDSRIGAWASPQSTVLESREDLEAAFAAAKSERGEAPRRPAHWGGYRLQPDRIEFWQGRPNRLHDRFVYEKPAGEAGWRIARLAP